LPPKNGKIALLLTTNGLMCSKHVSQKRDEAIDNCHWYKMLLNYELGGAHQKKSQTMGTLGEGGGWFRPQHAG